MAGSRVTPNLNLTGKWASVCGLSVDEGRFSPVGFNVLARKAIQFTEKSQQGTFSDTFYSSPPAWRMRYCHLWTNHRATTQYTDETCMTNSHWKLVFCFKRSILIGKITSDDLERRSADFLPSVVDCFVLVFFSESPVVYHSSHPSSGCNLHHAVQCSDMEKNSLFHSSPSVS